MIVCVGGAPEGRPRAMPGGYGARHIGRDRPFASVIDRHGNKDRQLRWPCHQLGE